MRWTGARHTDKPTVEVRTWIDAPPERVWALVSDIGLVPGTSHGLRSVEWLDGATEPAVGSRFLGRGSHEACGEWITTSYVIECEPCRVLAWAVRDPTEPSEVWRFRLHAGDGGTELSEWVQLVPGRSGLEEKIVFVRLREFEHTMTATLKHIKHLAETG
ncbi:SRPBCC family protein [Streptomyces sp. NBC_00847]|uniref:SRPBCC family protein n=1 Tax=Streptomyces sp. NBC_00847 TaxID=2975850 RepID=UPI0022512AFA|nr:SRPBCC family protein [Streptomyces sp. NBC_00847]MCX4878696.1 SRPBCC family protein [Streptomyces sp. NBC_00847]